MKRILIMSSAVILAWSQQIPAPIPAPPRPPTLPLTVDELEAIPLTPPAKGKSVTTTLFDGKTLTGWRGNLDWWSVTDGMIIGKSKGKVSTNFLFSKDSYSDFRLIVSSKMVESDNHAGVCFWSGITEQNANNKFYTHGPLVVFPKPSMWDYADAKGIRVLRLTTEPVSSQHEWVKVEILAQGNRVRTAINGVAVMDWREADLARVKAAPIGLQLHSWTGTQEVLYKDVVIETFPKEDRLITIGVR